MTDLKRLADEAESIRSYLYPSRTPRLIETCNELATLLRSAAGETVGTLLVEIGYAEACNNRNVYACRLALAAARKERAALQRAIDEAYAAVAFLSDGTAHTVTTILRPHATPSQPERAKEVRQWSSTPPSDRSGKWWNAFGFECSDQCLHLVPNTMTWDQAENGDDWGYDLWLPYVEGDTRDSLPPLPNSSATVTSSPAPASRPCDCRELVARLTECVEALASRRVFPHFLRDIIRDARGGGA